MQNTPAGSIITSVQSVSQNGKHVFQVPMFDPDKIPSGSAGFPWKADGDFRTVLYIQNVSDVERRFTAHLVFEGGQYAIGDRTIKPQETIAVDFREFRDEQTADKLGSLIPLVIDHGQIAWSARGGGPKTLSVRSEQISLSEGISSTYACYNGCCENRVIDGWIDPVSFQDVIGGSLFMSGTQIEETCYLEQFYSPIAFITWSSENTDVATIDTSGFAEAVGVGETTIFAFWQREWYYYGLGTVCELEHFPRNDEVPTVVDPPCTYPVNFRQVGSGVDVGDGALRFVYAWDSSDDYLGSLGNCTIGEKVSYPGGDPYVLESPPFPNISTDNPKILNLPATLGQFEDTHRILFPQGGPFVTPYDSSTYTATQFYRYRCGCVNGGEYSNVMGPLDIVRAVSPASSSSWKFVVTKSGSSATINPLP